MVDREEPTNHTDRMMVKSSPRIVCSSLTVYSACLYLCPPPPLFQAKQQETSLSPFSRVGMTRYACARACKNMTKQRRLCEPRALSSLPVIGCTPALSCVSLSCTYAYYCLYSRRLIHALVLDDGRSTTVVSWFFFRAAHVIPCPRPPFDSLSFFVSHPFNILPI